MKDDAKRHGPATLRFARGSYTIISTRRGAAMVGLALAAVLVGCGSGDDIEVAEPAGSVVQPLALPGPLPIACSNVAQDVPHLPPGGMDAKTHWGKASPRQTARRAT